MSYENFRNAFAARLLSVLPDPDQLCSVLSALDTVAAGYDVTLRSTDLIVSDGVPDAVRLYIASKSIQNLKKRSLEEYLRTLRAFFLRVRLPVDHVSANDVRLYLHWYKETRSVSESTLDGLRIKLNGFFEWCTDEEIIRKNPMRHVSPIRVPDCPRLPMSPTELETVRLNCLSLREKALVDFLFSTAARVSEVCNLELRHINFTDHTVRIEHGKGDKSRVTFLNAEAEVSLRAYLLSRNDTSPYLFVTSRGPVTHMSKKAVQEEISRICSRCTLSVHVTPHIFRHTAASFALQRGMPIDQVQKFLGHARIQTTLRYAKVLDFDVRLSHSKFVA